MAHTCGRLAGPAPITIVGSLFPIPLSSPKGRLKAKKTVDPKPRAMAIERDHTTFQPNRRLKASGDSSAI
jgi:hypothetical protein